MGLYKNRYLIAIYDKNDRFIECATKIKDLTVASADTIYSRISRGQFWKSKTKYRVYLIDCLEKHDDIFQEEDKIFLKENLNLSSTKNCELLAKKYNVDKRTIYRWIKNGELDLEKEAEEMANVI